MLPAWNTSPTLYTFPFDRSLPNYMAMNASHSVRFFDDSITPSLLYNYPKISEDRQRLERVALNDNQIGERPLFKRTDFV